MEPPSQYVKQPTFQNLRFCGQALQDLNYGVSAAQQTFLCNTISRLVGTVFFSSSPETRALIGSGKSPPRPPRLVYFSSSQKHKLLPKVLMLTKMGHLAVKVGMIPWIKDFFRCLLGRNWQYNKRGSAWPQRKTTLGLSLTPALGVPPPYAFWASGGRLVCSGDSFLYLRLLYLEREKNTKAEASLLAHLSHRPGFEPCEIPDRERGSHLCTSTKNGSGTLNEVRPDEPQQEESQRKKL
ncbi:hypothetical protein Pyn_04039 [Prunus yedoensis var. nudiflora]|uniref:Uncharacterized protein n=1 Tax=Prunus yedoensis var. nudiflora TaxID=2094558 RepID=A0A314Z740_PRUYE|nr:hypothetical protein Pyn_04039 [Prunus yedoensis var. nudiflora]